MPTVELNLSCDVDASFMNMKAADSVDMNLQEKTKFNFKVDANIPKDYSVGLIVGASGSGKTQLALEIFRGIDGYHLENNISLIDQFPKNYSYEDRTKSLAGVGLTSVPCWVRPAYTLSNGQKYRASVALSLAHQDDVLVLDEWTSVVNREVAKLMSEKVGKYVRENKRQAVFLSCHYDIIPWLNPDWVIDCNKQSFEIGHSQKKKVLSLPLSDASEPLGNILNSFTI